MYKLMHIHMSETAGTLIKCNTKNDINVTGQIIKARENKIKIHNVETTIEMKTSFD